MEDSKIKKMRRADFKAWRNDGDEREWAIALCEGDWFYLAMNCMRDGDMGHTDKNGDYSRLWATDEIHECEKSSVRPATEDEVSRYLAKVSIEEALNCDIEECIIITGSDSSYVLYNGKDPWE